MDCKQATKETVDFTWTFEQDDIGWADEHNITIKRILAEMGSGNEAAWFCAHLDASYLGALQLHSHLCGCSYSSFEEFLASESAEAMMNEAVDNINATLERAFSES